MESMLNPLVAKGWICRSCGERIDGATPGFPRECGHCGGGGRYGRLRFVPRRPGALLLDPVAR